MKNLARHPIISFLLSLIVSIVIVGIVYLFFFLLIFDLAGGETLNQVENQNMIAVFISMLLFVIGIIYCRRYYKNNKKYTAVGITIFPLAVMIAATVYLFDQNFNQTAFDKTIWAQSVRKPEKMAKKLVKEKTLIGLTRTEVKQILGEGAEEYGDKNTDRGSLIYHVEEEWTLSVIFRYDKVIETEMRLPWLGV